MSQESSKHHKGDCNVVLIVVLFIGAFALVGLLGIIIFLTTAVIKDKAIEATSVALLTTLGTLCGTAIGSLGSMLNQTRNEQQSRPVTVENLPSDPIPTAPQPPTP